MHEAFSDRIPKLFQNITHVISCAHFVDGLLKRLASFNNV